MRRGTTLIGLLLSTLSAPAASASPGERAPVDLGSLVREIFAVKCAQCHSAVLPRPKGKFGYVLDLTRIAANPLLLVRSDPAHSKLWQQIETGDMPPDDARAGPLTESEKKTIRLWIERNAPGPRLTASSPDPKLTEPAPEQTSATIPGVPALSAARRLLRLVGKLHVLVIHFPIALIAAAAVESWWMMRRTSGMSPIVRFCVFFGAAGAVVAAALGWVHAPFSGYGSSASGALLLHRWAGVTAAAGAMLAAGLSEVDGARGRRSRLFRATLFATALMIGVAGHLGGSLVYGDDFFRF